MKRKHFTAACLLGALVLSGCAAPRGTEFLQAHTSRESADAPPPVPESGALVVYSATFAATAEQSEYPVHTDYTIAATNDTVIERVTNRTGPFGAYPVKVTLPVGHYHVRAQYLGGRFVVVPVNIQPGKTTVIDLNDRPLPQGNDSTRQPIHLPEGTVVGWSDTGR